MSKKELKSGDDRIATPDEIKAAYSALTDGELIKLRKSAEYRSLPLKGFCRDEFSADSLIAEALIRTLDGRRKWKLNNVSFFHHLLSSIRSISWAYAQHLKTCSAPIEERLKRSYEHEEGDDIFDSIEVDAIDQETFLIWKELYEIVLDYFKNDNEVLVMIECMRASLKASEVCEYMSITNKRYAAIYKRLIRGIDKIHSN